MRPTNEKICTSSIVTLLILSLLLAFFSWTGSRAVWAGTNGWTSIGPDGGEVNSLAIAPQNPRTIYAGAFGGLFTSTDGGASWSALNSKRLGSVVSLAIDPLNLGTVYVVAASGIFKTSDGGANWSSPALTTFSVRTVTIDPRTPGTVFAGTFGNGIFKTTDGGANWNAVNSGLPATQPGVFNVITVAIDPQNSNNLYAGIFPPGNGFGVYKSTDGGANWSAAGSGLPRDFAVVSLAIDPQSPGTVYAVIYAESDYPSYADTRVFKSTDGGASWSAVNSGLPIEPDGHISYVSALGIDPQNSGTLYAGTNSGVFKSTNGGASWSAVNSQLTKTRIQSVVIDPRNPNTLYAGTQNGVFKTTDGGSTWDAVNSGLTTLDVQSLVIDPQDPNRLYAGTSGGGAFVITFVPDLVVTDLRFDRASVAIGSSFSVNISGPHLTSQTFFDVRFTSPGSNASDVILNWQRGVAANHGVPADTASGNWTINGVRAHEIETDHTGSFFPVSATITVSR